MKRLKKWDDNEIERLKLSKNLNFLENLIDSHRSALILIYSRSSNSIISKQRALFAQRYAEIKSYLTSELILKRLENAIYVDIYLSAFSLLNLVLLITSKKQSVRNESYAFASALKSVKKDTQVVFVSIDIDDILCNKIE